MFKEIFSKKSDNSESLVQSYKKIEEKKSDLTKKREEMRRNALSDSSEPILKKIASLTEEIELCNTGMEEIEKRLISALEDEARKDFESAPARLVLSPAGKDLLLLWRLSRGPEAHGKNQGNLPYCRPHGL